MRRRLMILTVVTSPATCPAASYELSEHQWRNRLLFLVAPDGDDPDLAAQQRNLDTDLREIFLQIDAMPMQRVEMRAKREAGKGVSSP